MKIKFLKFLAVLQFILLTGCTLFNTDVSELKTSSDGAEKENNVNMIVSESFGGGVFLMSDLNMDGKLDTITYYNASQLKGIDMRDVACKEMDADTKKVRQQLPDFYEAYIFTIYTLLTCFLQIRMFLPELHISVHFLQLLREQ